MDSFPVTSLPYHLQQEVIKKLKPRTALRLQKTCHWGLEAVDGCKQFSVLREVEENRRNLGSRWTGNDHSEIGFLVEIQVGEDSIDVGENIRKVTLFYADIFKVSKLIFTYIRLKFIGMLFNCME